ncbi:GtrA family protein [Novosphingobium bradum]|uniref:GtrA family protein n=1 Tax=Novosphingobium bradum TaxID=1737444 RepID=A0ABV7IMV5_9SPHN
MRIRDLVIRAAHLGQSRARRAKSASRRSLNAVELPGRDGQSQPGAADRWQFLRFCMVGAVNTSCSLALIWSLMAAGVGKYRANLAGYAVGICISFLLNRSWTFRESGHFRLGQVARFMTAFLLAYLCNIAAIALSIELGINPYLAQITGIPAYTLSFYVLINRFVFSNNLRCT